MKIIAGVDEAGRGPLAGPVVAAAVIFPENFRDYPGLRAVKDSKKLTPKIRDKLYNDIIQYAQDWAVGHASVEEIDRVNILQATMLAMQRAVLQLTLVPSKVLIDGNMIPELPYKSQAIIRGDTLISVISAASIIAKVTRDREMCQLDKAFPEYGFKQHKGYGTKQHMDAIKHYGPTVHHRRTFAPMRTLNNQEPVCG